MGDISQITIAEGLASNITTRPVLIRKGANAIAHPKGPGILSVLRAGGTGTIAVYRAGYSDPRMFGAGKELLIGDGSATQFQTELTYAAFSNYNWRLLIGQELLVMPQGAASGFAVTDVGGKARLDINGETDTGDGSTTAFVTALPWDLYDLFDLAITVNSVASTAWTASEDASTGNTTITFDAAPTDTHAIAYTWTPKDGVPMELLYGTVETMLAAGTNQNVRKDVMADAFMWAVGASSPSSSNIYFEPTL